MDPINIEIHQTSHTSADNKKQNKINSPKKNNAKINLNNPKNFQLSHISENKEISGKNINLTDNDKITEKHSNDYQVHFSEIIDKEDIVKLSKTNKECQINGRDSTEVSKDNQSKSLLKNIGVINSHEKEKDNTGQQTGSPHPIKNCNAKLNFTSEQQKILQEVLSKNCKYKTSPSCDKVIYTSTLSSEKVMCESSPSSDKLSCESSLSSEKFEDSLKKYKEKNDFENNFMIKETTGEEPLEALEEQSQQKKTCSINMSLMDPEDSTAISQSKNLQQNTQL